MSGFVSGGTNDAPTARDEAWLKAQQEIEARRLAKLDADKQQDGKSLYETLQANKAAKQEAFEEASKLKNQFRTLDEDEVEFLESVYESSRAKEAEAQRDTQEQLAIFKSLQEDAERASKHISDEAVPEVAETWTTTSRKRKNKDDTLRGIRKRRISSIEQSKAPGSTAAAVTAPRPSTKSNVKVDKAITSAKQQSSNDVALENSTSESKAPLGLTGYSSSEED